MAPKKQTEMIKNPPVASSTEDEEQVSGSSKEESGSYEKVSESSPMQTSVAVPVTAKKAETETNQGKSANEDQVKPILKRPQAGKSDSEPAAKKTVSDPNPERTKSTLHASWDMVADGPKKRKMEMRMKKIKAFQAELCLWRSRIVAEAAEMILKD